MNENENANENTVLSKEDTINSCEVCMADNLLKDVGIKRCLRCNEPYCIHFASVVDPVNYCVDCMSDLELLKNEQVYKREYYDEKDDKIKPVIRRARILKIGGLDYLFAQRKIASMTDAEQELAIEYHREMVTSLILDREERKVKTAHAKSISIKVGTTSTSTTIKTPTAQTTQTRIDKKMAQLAALLQGKSAADKAALLLKILGGK